jgi:hypothetical protein
MWRKVSKAEEDDYLKKAIEFTGDAKLYGSYMRRVVREWPVACEQNLTDENTNRRAWVGHAAASLAINCPEYVTRMAWAFLSNEQQRLANREASDAIAEWEAVFTANPTQQLCLNFT